MGKSPGRWIKTVLFGKKHSKSRSSKNITPDTKVSIRATAEDNVGNSPDISATHELMENGAPYVRLENRISDTTSFGGNLENRIPDTTSFGGNQGQELIVVSVPLSNDEILRQNQSAAKAQAAFRGYLARRAFRALKGIIRLQALIRGHLVRRQAAATLYSMQAIVKLQTAIRGWNAGFSSSSEKRPWKYNAGDFQVMNYESVATNSYIRKLLRSVPTAMPLALQYEETEPNSASLWLDRWSDSQIWVSVHPRKVSIIKSHRKQALQNDSVKSKRTSRKVDNAQSSDNGVSASDETDAKRNLKKATSHQADLVQKQPQNELEKVKRSLRKAPASVTPVSEKIETVIEEPEPQSSVKTGYQPEEPAIDADETMNPITTDNNGFEVAPGDEAVEVTRDLSPVAANHLENGTELKHEEMGVKDNQKVRERRSLPAKPEFNESPSPNTPPPSLRSYMAATQSAKAKLRASGSPKVVDGGNHIRRHSLPTSNGKSASISPGVQPQSSKGAIKTNKSPASIRDGWKR